jgi:dihydrofolate synthase/folylpolyglutamate synthase
VRGGPAVAALGRDRPKLAEKAAAKRRPARKTDDFSVTTFADPAAAFANAVSRAEENDRIVVFGSFYTVAGVMAARKNSLH